LFALKLDFNENFGPLKERRHLKGGGIENKTNVRAYAHNKCLA
jgi:hypothetical protein